MSDLLGDVGGVEETDEEWWDDGGDEDPALGPVRKHALWGLLVLFLAAAIAGILMVLLGRGGHAPQVIVPAPPVSSPATAASSPGVRPAERAATEVPVTGLPARPGATGNPCAGRSSCLVSGDGGAVTAANAIRTAHRLAPVSGAVTPDAQSCAETHGGGPTCVPHYAYTTLSAQDGAGAVDKVNAFSPKWLLDPATRAIQVGWWYAGGTYNFAILKSA